MTNLQTSCGLNLATCDASSSVARRLGRLTINWWWSWLAVVSKAQIIRICMNHHGPTNDTEFSFELYKFINNFALSDSISAWLNVSKVTNMSFLISGSAMCL